MNTRANIHVESLYCYSYLIEIATNFQKVRDVFDEDVGSRKLPSSPHGCVHDGLDRHIPHLQRSRAIFTVWKE